ncbi:Uncharacterised protein [Mycobacterium tuberculosis]|nr:Uncharacterised protein [Mycobacterium tuberculosis]
MSDVLCIRATRTARCNADGPTLPAKYPTTMVTALPR